MARGRAYTRPFMFPASGTANGNASAHAQTRIHRHPHSLLLQLVLTVRMSNRLPLLRIKSSRSRLVVQLSICSMRGHPRLAHSDAMRNINPKMQCCLACPADPHSSMHAVWPEVLMPSSGHHCTTHLNQVNNRGHDDNEREHLREWG